MSLLRRVADLAISVQASIAVEILAAVIASVAPDKNFNENYKAAQELPHQAVGIISAVSQTLSGGRAPAAAVGSVASLAVLTYIIAISLG
jgi:hypothetical protein